MRAEALPKRDNTCAVVVAYRPGPGLEGNVARASAQCARVFLVDNGSSRDYRETLDRASAPDNVELISNPGNLGMAAALNLGFDAALKAGATWVLTLDQDSLIQPDFLNALAAILGIHPAPEQVAVLAANYLDRSEKLEKRGYVCPGGDSPWYEPATAITSGSLHSTSAFRRSGPFREEFFIDHVDHDYCLRARAAGYRVVVVKKPLMEHKIGDISHHEVLGKLLETSNHNALRRYFFHRNGMVLVKERITGEPAWCLKLLCYFFPTGFINLCLFEKDRPAKIRAVAKGLWHGLIGRLGGPETYGGGS